MRVLSLRLAALAAALLVTPSVSQAAFMAPFSGNGQFFAPVPTADGIVNFAVYDNTDGGDAFTEIFGAAAVTNLAGSSTTANFPGGTAFRTSKYIFLYQVVNTQGPVSPDLDPITGLPVLDPITGLPLDEALNGLFVKTTTANVTGVGAVNGYVFTDAQGNVGPTANQALGLAPVLDPLGVSDGIAPGAGQAPTGVANVGSAAVSITSAGVQAFPGFPPGSSIRFDLPSLLTDQYTSLMFIASDGPPVISGGAIRDGGSAVGDVAVPTPEPTTLALLALGLPVAGARYVRRRLRKADAAV